MVSVTDRKAWRPDLLVWGFVGTFTAKHLIAGLAALMAVGLLSGCTTTATPQQRTAKASQIALQAGWESQVLVTDSYALMSWGPKPTKMIDILTVYIEGDGYAWVGGRYPSEDPTPIDPVALRLAVAQPNGNAAYLARPCQFLLELNGSKCRLSVWTRDRFSAPVVNAMNQGLDQIKHTYGARALVLVGYSGGARIALELAAERHDIVQVVTVAGNLDPQAWIEAFGMLPLTSGMDNDALISATKHLPQVHLVGDNDVVVPMELANQFVGLYLTQERSQARQEVKVLAGYGHVCCWAQQWPELWHQRSASVDTDAAN